MAAKNDAARWLFGLTRGRRGALAAIIAASAVLASMGAAFALLCRGIIDCAVARDGAGIAAHALILGGMVAAQVILQFISRGLTERVRAQTEMQLRSALLGRTLSAELAQVRRYHSGELLNRMFSDANICSAAVAELVPNAVSMGVRIVCAAAVMTVLQPWFAALFVAAGAAVFAVTRLLRTRLKGLHRRVQEKEGEVRSFMQEALESAAVIKAFGVQERVLARNDEAQRGHFSLRMKRRTLNIAAGAGFGLVFQAGYVLALVWGAYGIFAGAMTYGTLTAVLQLVNQIQSPFAALSGLFPQYYAAAASAERLMEIENLPQEEAPRRTLRGEDFTELAVSGVSFSYGSREVITRADFSLERGSVTALTGVSGGGKTTLFLLLLGAYRPQTGSIAFRAGGESYGAGQESRGIAAYVPQGNCLFSGTVRDNISFMERSPDDARIMEAARAACAEEFINALPQGLDTPLGENGTGLSEGQAQRIAIARALYSGAQLLLLDEATSALDAQTESAVLQNIAEMRGKTVLIVTHRPAALEICDKQLTLKDGVIE